MGGCYTCCKMPETPKVCTKICGGEDLVCGGGWVSFYFDSFGLGWGERRRDGGVRGIGDIGNEWS